MFVEKIEKSCEQQHFSRKGDEADNELTGALIGELLENISRKESFYVKEKEEVRKEWGLYSESLSRSLKKLRNLYLSPSKLQPKTVDSLDQLSKLFEKE